MSAPGFADESGPLTLAGRYYDAFNARDFDAWQGTLDDDVEVIVDAGVMRGRAAALLYVNGILQAYPGVTVSGRRVVAVSSDAVVSEFQLINPRSAIAAGDPVSEPAVPWRLDGVTCEILRLRGGRLISLHSYYSPKATDRTPIALVPSREEAARIAHRQAALGRVATQVAGGGSESELVAVINQVIAEFAGVEVSLMMRFDSGDTAVVLAASELVVGPDLVGRRLAVRDDIRAVRDSGRSLRFGPTGWPLRDSHESSPPDRQLQWCVGVPISLHGRVWGISLLGSTRDEPFADDIEEGIAAFTQLVSTTLANAQANDELRVRAQEQSELLEVAEIAAGGAEPPAVFAAIARSASALLDGLPTMLLRFVDEDSADLLAVHGFHADVPPAGKRVVVDPTGVTAEVQRSGRSARIDDYRKPPGNQLATQVGIRASVGVPVAVGGRPWGIVVASSMDRALPAAAERRLSLVAGTGAAAIAGAQARGELLALAQEQAALRRVAELVARGVGQDEIYTALTAEATGLIDEPTALVRFEDAGSYTVVAVSGGPAPDGASVETGPESLFAEIHRTRRPARIDGVERPGRIDGNGDQDNFGGSCGVGVPIIVGVRLWGMLTATSAEHRLATTIEHRLRQFVGIMAVAVANGEARRQLQNLADEQAALRRVAELAARDAQAEEVLAVLAKETSVLSGVDFGMVLKYDGRDGGNQIVAVGTAPADFVLAMHASGDRDGAAQRIWQTGRPAQIDDLSQLDGRWPRLAQANGFASSAGVPIVIRGELWGALIVVGRRPAFPPDLEEHLTHFAELAGTAIATTEARRKLRDLADEQAALRRIAELAAREAPAEEILRAVTVEAAGLAGVDFSTLLHYEPDGSTVVVALDGAPAGIVTGMRAPATGDGAVQRVWRTGRPARVDNLADMSGAWPQVAARHGFNASAAVPVVIHGKLRGTLVVVGRQEAFPQSIEEHLADFADLAATALSAADARQGLRLLANEQAAVRRVAELVARSAALGGIFDAVAAETSTLLGNVPSSLLRYDDTVAVVVASANSPTPDEPPAGSTPETGDTWQSVTVPVTVEGTVWGALSVAAPGPPAPPVSVERLTPFAELTAVAIVNAENRSKLTASRARVIATADETRRRVQRDVHDGAQQRLVHTIIVLKMARDAALAGEPLTELLAEALSNAERASKELRDIVRGILPASLTRGGLRSGLESLLADLALPVELSVSAPRLSPQIETTAYFIVAEAITNVVKHARAERAIVVVTVDGINLLVEIGDDGVGGADARNGSGLTGLLDRVEAGNGTLVVTSGPGAGTVVRAVLPLDRQSSELSAP